MLETMAMRWLVRRCAAGRKRTASNRKARHFCVNEREMPALEPIHSGREPNNVQSSNATTNTGIDMSGRRPFIKGYFAVVR
jgi:hypothetical protein